MGDGLELEVEEGDPGPLLRKRATGPDGRAALAAEAARAERARHPGVVTLVDRDEDSLAYAWAGNRSLAVTVLSARDAATVLTAVATTVADLHDIGVVHGRLDPSHVVLDRGLRPRLCGLRPPAGEPSPDEDVGAIARLVLDALDRSADPAVPRRSWRDRRADARCAERLRAVAHDVLDPDRAVRPGARALADRLAAIAPGSAPSPSGRATVSALDADETLGDRSAPASTITGARSDEGSGGDQEGVDPAGEEDRDIEAEDGAGVERAGPRPALVPPPARARRTGTHRRPLPPRTAGRAAVTVLALVGLVVGVQQLRRDRSSDRAPTAAAPSTDSGVRRPSGTTTTVPCPSEIGGAPTADVDGDGCREALAIRGTTLVAGGRTYRVGRPGDRVAVGDWDCDGTLTPSVVRPATGEIFVFDRWATAGRPRTVSATATVVGATRLEPRTGPCRAPRVRLADGTSMTLSIRGPST